MTKQIENGKIIRKSTMDGSMYCKLAVEDMHGEYSLPEMEGIEIREVWDGNAASDIITEYLKVSGLVPGVPSGSINEELLRRTMHKILGDGPWRCPQPIDGVDSPTDTIIQIDGKAEALTEWAVLVSEDLIKESADVGGDDSYYDYFPGYVYMFRSICKELVLQELYDDTVAQINAGRYADDEETIPTW